MCVWEKDNGCVSGGEKVGCVLCNEACLRPLLAYRSRVALPADLRHKLCDALSLSPSLSLSLSLSPFLNHDVAG